MSKLEFKPEQIKIYEDFVNGSIVVAKASKEIFKAEFALFKANPLNPLKVKALSRRTIEALTDDNNLIGRVKKISTLAEKYTKHEVLAKFDVLYFYNIEKIVGIFELLESNSKQELGRTLRQIIADVWNKEMSQTDYNNAVGEALREFMKEHKMQEVNGEFVFKDAFDTITALLAQMDIIQLQKIGEAVAEYKKHPKTEEVAEDATEEAAA